MALIIDISTGDSQIRGNVLSLSSSEEKVENGLLGLSDFYHNYLISDVVFSTLERHPFATPN